MPVAAIQFQNPARHIIQKVAIVGHGDHGAFILLQMLLQPQHRFGIQVVGRFVEQQNIGLLEQQPAQRHPPLLAAGEHAHLLVRRRATQGIHRDLEFAVEIPPVRRFDLFLQLGLLVDELFHFIRAGITHAVADRFVFVQQPHELLLPLFDDLLHGLVRIELRFLFQQPHGVTFGTRDLADIVVIQSRR